MIFQASESQVWLKWGSVAKSENSPKQNNHLDLAAISNTTEDSCTLVNLAPIGQFASTLVPVRDSIRGIINLLPPVNITECIWKLVSSLQFLWDRKSRVFLLVFTALSEKANDEIWWIYTIPLFLFTCHKLLLMIQLHQFTSEPTLDGKWMAHRRIRGNDGQFLFCICRNLSPKM